LKQPFVIGSIQTSVGPVPQVSSFLVWADRSGTYKARWGIGRMHYTIEPGLYALGKPDRQSPVLVTANYKMSFDKLREALPGRDMWILVLDTKGINVWCASGKGTFGAMELVGRIKSTGLSQIVSHRELILPQLSGPGVAAHHVKKLSGFKVIYGPIRATDLLTFLDHRLKATPSYVGKSGEGWMNALSHGYFSALSLLTAILAGAVLTPLFLPWLPGRAFSIKGLSLGFLFTAVLMVFFWKDGITGASRLEILAWFFLIPAVSAYLAMNFTGASTYTSLSGVRKEMRRALPLEIIGGIVGLILWFGSHYIA
jgi:acetyl-CoA decarbonylase/synthase complex subunit gamma